MNPSSLTFYESLLVVPLQLGFASPNNSAEAYPSETVVMSTSLRTDALFASLVHSEIEAKPITVIADAIITCALIVFWLKLVFKSRWRVKAGIGIGIAELQAKENQRAEGNSTWFGCR